MSDIVVVTYPDKVYNDNHNLLLIGCSPYYKTELQKVLAKDVPPVNVYLYDSLHDRQTQLDQDYEIEHKHQHQYLLDLINTADTILIDLDNCDAELSTIISFVLGKTKSFWLTKGENMFYNTINNNRVYDIDFILTRISKEV